MAEAHHEWKYLFVLMHFPFQDIAFTIIIYQVFICQPQFVTSY